MDESSDLTVARVFREKDPHPVPGDRDEDGEVGFEAVFPLDFEAEAFRIEGAADLVAEDPQGRDDALLSHLGKGFRRVLAVTEWFPSSQRSVPICTAALVRVS